MYIRRADTAPRRNHPGQKYHTYRLAHVDRSGTGIRQVSLLNLGAHFPVPEADWPALLALVEDLRADQPHLLPPDPELLSYAKVIARRLDAIGFDPDAAPDRDLATVHLDSLEHSRSRSVGGERLALHAFERLGLPDALRACGLGDRDARIALSLLVARMLQPGSEHAAHHWLSHSSAAWELLELDGPPPPSLQKLYRIGDRLWEHREALEKALFEREREVLGLPRTIVFYDLTNVHYYGRARGDLQRGRSKQKRHDCPLMTLALTLDAAGFPRRSQVLPGNVSEPGTLEEALQQLEALPDGGAERPTVVMDAGLSTAANIAWLQAQGYAWITVQRGRAERPDRDPDMQVQTAHGHAVLGWQLESTEEEAEVCLWSAERQAKDDAIVARQRKIFEEGLQGLHAGLSKKHCTKDWARVVERVGKLRKSCPRVSGQYRVEVLQEPARPASKGKGQAGKKARKAKKSKAAPRAQAVRWERTEQHAASDLRAGTYVLRTSHVDWDPARLAETYWRLNEVEATFRSLKGEIGLRPIWHAKQDRIRAHLFLAVLAYHGVHLLRTLLQRHGIRTSWAGIRQQLSSWVRLTTTLTTKDGELINSRQDTRPNPEAVALARAVGVQPRLHRKRWRSRFPAD